MQLRGLSMGSPPFRICAKFSSLGREWYEVRYPSSKHVTIAQLLTSIGFDRDLSVTVPDHLLFEVSSIEARLLDLFFLRSLLTESVQDVYSSCMNASSTDRSTPPALRRIMNGGSHFDIR